jgi:hypothetical protein
MSQSQEYTCPLQSWEDDVYCTTECAWYIQYHGCAITVLAMKALGKS